jgi:hypothetical protein
VAKRQVAHGVDEPAGGGQQEEHGAQRLARFERGAGGGRDFVGAVP